jgi:hypothetical protein
MIFGMCSNRPIKHFQHFETDMQYGGHLNTALKPLRFLISLGKSATELTLFTPESTVLSAVLYLLTAAEGVSATYDAIEALL